MNNMHNFSKQKQNAINQMNEMKKRAAPSKEADSKPKVMPIKPQISQSKPLLSGGLSLSDDTLILLGLILILYSDSSDMLLLLALAYILM